jgi:hypothetical protein
LGNDPYTLFRDGLIEKLPSAMFHMNIANLCSGDRSLRHGRHPLRPFDRPHRPARPSLSRRSAPATEPGVRASLVQRVRAEIAAGTYLSESRLDAALDALLHDLD